MQNLLYILFKILKRSILYFRYHVATLISRLLFYFNKIPVGKNFQSTGIPFVSCSHGGIGSIGNNFRIHNSMYGNPIGRSHKCMFVIGPIGNLKIGNNVGMSFTAINCKKSITVEDHVIIGGGTCIYDSDFHPLSAEERLSNNNENIMAAEVTIESNTFIGTNCTILKGVTIGNGSIVGAGSVVTKNIPPGEIWAGNPARFIKKID